MFKDTYIILPRATANSIPMTNAAITPTTIPIMAATENLFITEPPETDSIVTEYTTNQ